MTAKPRRFLLSTAVFALICLMTADAAGQTRGARDATRGKDAVKNARTRRSEAELQRTRERQEAAAVLLEVADAARSLADLYERVQLQAEAADALWPLDAQAARSILRRAWEATTAPGALEAFAPEDDARFDASDLIISARQIVINVAAKHDPRLAETYMRDMRHGLAEEDEEVAAGDGEAVRPRDTWREPGIIGQRQLATAHELINLGEYASAARIAAPVVAEGVTRSLLEFILRLRSFDSTEADALYLRLLERARLDSSTDANDVLLLATPVVSPDLHVNVSGDGSISFAQPIHRSDLTRRAPAVELPSHVRRAFYDTAAAVLARTASPRDGVKSRGNTSAAYYFAAGRLLPFIEREAPHHSPRLRALMAALSSDFNEARREDFSRQMKTRSLSPSNPTDPLRLELEELNRARDDEERNRIRFINVGNAARRRLWDRARRIAEEITDAETRAAASSLITVNQVRYLYEAFEQEKTDAGFEKAAAFARNADVPHAARALGLMRAAELAAHRGRAEAASELFDEAITNAAQVEKRTDVNITLLALLVDAAARFKHERAWELLSQLTAAVNETDADDGPDCEGILITAREDFICVPLSERRTELRSVYARMVELDSARALAETRSLKDEALRPFALVAVARAIIGGGEAAKHGKAR